MAQSERLQRCLASLRSAPAVVGNLIIIIIIIIIIMYEPLT